VLTHAQLQEQELQIHKQRRVEELERKVTKRKVLQKFGGLTARDAQLKLNAIEKKEREAEEKRQKRARDRLWRQERDRKYKEGVEAREQERVRKRKIKALVAAKQEVPLELLVPIPDPEKIWKAEQEELSIQLQMRQLEQEEEEVTFVTDTTGDASLQPDYIAFSRVESDDSSSSGTEDLESESESELYNSDNDYSWHGRYRGN
jgi:hypothetical protein